MIRQEQLSVVIEAQQRIFLNKQDWIIREALQNVPIVDNYATIIRYLFNFKCWCISFS